MRNNGGPAFPCKEFSHIVVVDGDYPQEVFTNAPGMTLRDYFAAKAMQALIMKIELTVSKADCEHFHIEKWKAISKGAYKYADAMLEEKKLEEQK